MLKNEKTAACDPKEISLKTFFLGPQAENATWVINLLDEIFERWVNWRRSLFPGDGKSISSDDQLSPEFIARREKFEKVTHELFQYFEKEVPKFSPRYVGHMFSEISLPALVGHIVTLLHNPNNISGESSRVGIQIEAEAVDFLLSMVGFQTNNGAGHFTSGGTLANFEALVRAISRYALWLSAGALLKDTGLTPLFEPVEASLMGWQKFDEAVATFKRNSVDIDSMANWNISSKNPFEVAAKINGLSDRDFLGPVMLVPENKHYSWIKGCHLLGLGKESLWPIALDSQGHLSTQSLHNLIELAVSQGRPILLVVSVVGTTELGGIDPVHAVQNILDEWREKNGLHIWHHVDGAYGGLFRSLDLNQKRVLSEDSRAALQAISRVDSVTLDPHKLGYVPYASGTFLVRDKRNYYFTAFDDAPYIDFDRNLDRGQFTLEGSRSAAGAVATWMTAKTMGLTTEGYGLLLERTMRIQRDLASRLTREKVSVQLAPGCDTNILCFSCAIPGEKLSVSNERTLKIFKAFSPRENGLFIVSKTTLRKKSYDEYLEQWTKSWSAVQDTDEIILIRMCLMNPFFATIEANVDYSSHFIECLKEHLGE